SSTTIPSVIGVTNARKSPPSGLPRQIRNVAVGIRDIFHGSRAPPFNGAGAPPPALWLKAVARSRPTHQPYQPDPTYQPHPTYQPYLFSSITCFSSGGISGIGRRVTVIRPSAPFAMMMLSWPN